jgi:hypothetical protein
MVDGLLARKWGRYLEDSMIPGYALQQLRAAVSMLSGGQDRLQRRLRSAYRELEPLIAADFPDDLGKDYSEVMSRLTNVGAAETTPAMSNEEASQLAASIVKLHHALETTESAKAPASSGQLSVEADPPLAAR